MGAGKCAPLHKQEEATLGTRDKIKSHRRLTRIRSKAVACWSGMSSLIIPMTLKNKDKVMKAYLIKET